MVGEEMKGKVFWKAREGGRGASREERQVKKKSRRFILVSLLAILSLGSNVISSVGRKSQAAFLGRIPGV